MFLDQNTNYSYSIKAALQLANGTVASATYNYLHCVTTVCTASLLCQRATGLEGCFQARQRVAKHKQMRIISARGPGSDKSILSLWRGHEDPAG